MKVVVAIDNSQCSAAIIKAVADRSWPADTTFEVITVVEPVNSQYCFAEARSMASLTEVERQIVEYCQQLVNGKRSELAAIFGEDKVSCKVIEGSIANTIVDYATEVRADLIVLGSHGRTGIHRFLLGSVAARVANYASCTVDIVKEKVAAAKNSKGAAKKTMLMVPHH